jgi:hypothetical protein
VKRATVREAAEAYLADLRRHGRVDTARDVESRFRTVLYEDILADLDLEAVTRDDFLEWRDRLIEVRQPRTVNRHARSVMAALKPSGRTGLSKGRMHLGQRLRVARCELYCFGRGDG